MSSSSKTFPEMPSYTRLDSTTSTVGRSSSTRSGGADSIKIHTLLRTLSSSSSSSSSFESLRASRSVASTDGSEDGGDGPFVWLAVLRAKLEYSEELASFLKGVSDRVLENEPDVLSHRILRGVDDEDEIRGRKFVVYAEFRNDDAFDEHIQTDEFQKLVNNADWLAEPPQMFSYRDVPLGDGEGSEYGSAQVE